MAALESIRTDCELANPTKLEAPPPLGSSFPIPSFFYSFTTSRLLENDLSNHKQKQNDQPWVDHKTSVGKNLGNVPSRFSRSTPLKLEIFKQTHMSVGGWTLTLYPFHLNPPPWNHSFPQETENRSFRTSFPRGPDLDPRHRALSLSPESKSHALPLP